MHDDYRFKILVVSHATTLLFLEWWNCRESPIHKEKRVGKTLDN